MKRLEYLSSTKLLLLTAGVLAVTFMTLAVEKVDIEYEHHVEKPHYVKAEERKSVPSTTSRSAYVPQAKMAAPANITSTSEPITLPSGRQIVAAELFNAVSQPYFDHLFFLNDYNKQTIVFSGPFDTYNIEKNASGEWQVTPLTTYANNGVETNSNTDTYYYGYHKIKRTRTYTVSQTRTAKSSGGCSPTYSISSTGSVSTTFKSISYAYVSTTGSTSPALKNTAKPADELTDRPSYTDAVLPAWSCTSPQAVYDNNSSHNETRTTTKSVTDYLYIWARINGSALDSNGLTPDTDIDGGGFMTDKNSDTSTKQTDGSCYLIAGTGGAQSLSTTVDIPTRLTRHVLVVETDGGSYTTKADYLDYTNYLPSYATSTTNTNAFYNDAIYHDYGANGASVEMLTSMTNKADVVSSTLQASGIWYYQKSGNKYVLTSSDYNTPNAAISGKIYITGENHRLNAGTTGDGWLQPQNADIYLDGVSMQCASKGSTAIYTVEGASSSNLPSFTYTTPGGNGKYLAGQGKDNNSDWRIASPTSSQATFVYREYPDNKAVPGTTSDHASALQDKDTIEVIHGSAAVFYFIEGSKTTSGSIITYGDNNSYIHLRGNNYIAGQEGRTHCVQVRAWLCSETARCMSANQEVTISSPPLQMKDCRDFYVYKDKEDKIQTWNYNQPNGGGDHIQTNYPYPWRVERDVTKSNVPSINCSFDNLWIDEEVNEDAYLDLSASNTFSRYHNNDGVEYISSDTYRFAPPLTTGGQNCSYIINGGHLNLWPANGYASSFTMTRNMKISGCDVPAYIQNVGAYSNYLICGAQQYNLDISNSNIGGAAEYVTVDVDLKLNVHGVGGGYPVGSLIVNGGTISTITDPNSFANVGKENIGNGGTILASNIQINGGSFRTGTVKSITDPTAHLMVEGATSALPAAKRVDPKNKFNETLSRTPITTDPEGAALTANHDYSDTWASEPLMNLGIDKKGWLVKKGSEYIYGTNMIADAGGKAYYYLPSSYTSQAKVKNYILNEENQTIATSAALTANPAWILTIQDGQWDTGALTQNYAASDQVAVNTKKTIRYIRPATASGSGYMDNWFGLYFPFNVQKITEGRDFEINAYVPEKDNSNSWFYMYHFDGTDIEGSNETFSAHQQPNSTPSGTMNANTAYILQFPDDYWNTSTVMFHSAEGATLPASSTALSATTAPTAPNTFRLGGNPTATTKILPKGYVLDAVAASSSAEHEGTEEDFVYVENYTLKPFQMYMLASDATYEKYKIVGKRFILQDNTENVDAAVSPTLNAYGTKGLIHLLSSENELVRIYDIKGSLVGQEYTEAETALVVPMSSGLYIIVGEKDNIKVRVE